MDQHSVETILTAPAFHEIDDMDQWSTVWSTTHVPGMDTATGGGSRKRTKGRRRLRIGANTVCCLMAMHCRVTAIALKGSFFVFILMLTVSVGLLGNPLRHFEVYLGQWSISGPGRAFRIIPMLDGVGIAICINSLVRAVTSSVTAAMTAIYVLHATSDAPLPFAYCRDFQHKAYNASFKEIHPTAFSDPYAPAKLRLFIEDSSTTTTPVINTIGFKLDNAWRNLTYPLSAGPMKPNKLPRRITLVCNETFPGRYPAIFISPPYNYFFVEVVRYHPELKFNVNIPVLINTCIVWVVVWLYMLLEKFHHSRLIWNNMYPWFIVIPWIWAVTVVIISVINYVQKELSVRWLFQIGGSRDILGTITDAFEVAMYIHASSVGTEVIHGKGLNHYARGHIDPFLNGENVWLTCVVFGFSALHTSGAAICAITDYIQVIGLYKVKESALWVLPMYSKCTSRGNYSHFSTALVFSGLTFAYVTTAVVLFKTSLHIIFEYKVKLVFIEQYLVAGLILMCMTLSALFSISNAGLAVMEAVDAVMSGIAMPLICALETFGFLYVYQSRDFVSDMNVATEENNCSSRLGIQWQITPFICLVVVLLKLIVMSTSEIPGYHMLIALIPLICVIISIPLRACRNAFVFFRPKRK